MPHHYTAVIYASDGEKITNSADQLDILNQWVSQQIETSFDEVHGEMIDNTNGQIVKYFHYDPPDVS